MQATDCDRDRATCVGHLENRECPGENENYERAHQVNIIVARNNAEVARTGNTHDVRSIVGSR